MGECCEIDRVPKDLQDDIRLMAELLEARLPQIRDAAAALPEQAQQAKEHVDPVVDKASKV